MRQKISRILDRCGVSQVKSKNPKISISFMSDLVISSYEDGVAVVTLNRPQKLNSLNSSMVSSLLSCLTKSIQAKVVILRLSSDRAFCSGGDVAQAAQHILYKQPEAASEFFYQEYSLNYLCAVYPRPIVSYIDGITMGGGVGLSCHGQFRVCTERTRLAMPEMDIGFFSDVGTSFLLTRMGPVGKYIGLTGYSVYGSDNVGVGFATHYVKSDKLDALTEDLRHLESYTYESVRMAISRYSESPQTNKFLTGSQKNVVEKAFAHNSLDAIMHALEEDPDPFAKEIYATLCSKSPTSLAITCKLFAYSAQHTIRQALNKELVLAQNIMAHPVMSDFVEGVSKKLITKTNDPSWRTTSYKHIASQDVKYLLNNTTHVAYKEVMNFEGVKQDFYEYSHQG